MQCSTCNRELAGQTHCEVCAPQDGASGAPADIVEGDAEERLADDSNAPHAPEATPRAADSSEDASGQPPEAKPAEVPGPRPPESPLAESTVETASGPSIDSEGEQSILEKAFQTIEDIYQDELGGEHHPLRDVYSTGIGSVQSDKFHIGGSGGDTYQTDIRGDVSGGIRIDVHAAAQASKAEEVSLYSLIGELPARTLELHESAQAEVREKVAQLKATRLMFITCPYDKFAVDAGYVAVGELGLDNPAHKRLLNYEDAAAEKKFAFTARNLLEQIPKEEEARAILVYAQSESAQSALDSFFDTPTRIDMVRAELRRKRLFLIVIAAPRDAQRRLAPLKRTPLFAYAEVPFLHPFLRLNFPDDCERLEAAIVEQRAGGKWEKDETRFCQQIVDFYETERLESVVAAGGPDDPGRSAEALLKGSGPVEKSVLYTAAFFQEVTTAEFCSVVEALLDGRLAAAPTPASGGDSPARAGAATPLDRIWEEEKDRIFNEWLRETAAAKAPVRVVALSNSALREPLQKLFEKQHRFYLIDQFEALQQRGVFFHPSPRLAENTAKIAVRMAGAYPDKFNETWIVELVGHVRSHFGTDAADSAGAMFQSLRSLQPGAALNLALARVAAVLRRMMGSPPLAGAVQSSLEQLLKVGYHEDALLLVNQLQFAPEFDALHWFRQLLHRANNRTRHLTYYCLYGHLKRMGGGVYEGFKKIEAWLPKAELQAESLPRARPQPDYYVLNAGPYSQFDHFVLRLLIQYCVETVARFNAKHYGQWPSRYPLFAIKDDAEAEERTSLIARWLLHPGIESTLVRLKMGGTRMTLIGALLAEWAFILLGPGDVPAADDDTPCSPEGLFDLLVGQFASRTNLSQRLELLKYWNTLNHDLLKYQVRLPAASTLRSQLSWKRTLVGRLITQIKHAPAAGETLPASRVPR